MIYLYIFIVIILILLLINIRRINIKKIKIELFKNNCDGVKNPFCSYDHDENKCKCVYQKDDLHINFPINNNCCSINCEKLNKDNCNISINNNIIEEENINDNLEISNNEIDFWCPLAGKCIKYKGVIGNNNISSNNCGYDILNNQLILPFSSEKECLSQIDPCEKYNDQNMSITERRKKCLSDVNCGMCINGEGDGKCISGNATQPNDLIKYYYCDPTKKGNDNKYIYGNQMEYILQK